MPVGHGPVRHAAGHVPGHRDHTPHRNHDGRVCRIARVRDVLRLDGLRASSGAQTERMVDLARLLGGGDSDSVVFSEKELGHAREIRFFPGLDPYSHPSHFDQLADPKDCAVRRTFLNHDGGVHRTESLSLPCDEYWELVAWIDGYYESRGSLPTSQTDLQVLAMEFRTEEGPCSQ